MRLDRLLSQAGLGSRKEVKKLISSGKITMNGEIIRRPGIHVDLQTDKIAAMGNLISYKPYYYIMMNKPDGIVSATHDNLYETVIDWIALDYHHVDLFPIGRLDKDTTGLLLLTNNGQLAHQLTNPKKGVPKIYHAIVEGIPDKKAVQSFENGIVLEDFTTLPARLTLLEKNNDYSEVEVEITEGKYHQVKRMLSAVGHKVIALHRVSMGPINLDENLMLGEYRELTSDEMKTLEPYGLLYE